MAEKETPAPSGTGADTDGSGTPRPIARRPHPVIKPSTEVISLQQIGGGAIQPPGGAAAPPPSESSSAALNAPLSPSSLGAIGPLTVPAAAPTDSSASPGAASALPTGKTGGLSGVGQSGAVSPPKIDMSVPQNLPPPPVNQPVSSGGSVMDRRPLRPIAAAEEPGFDTRKALMIGISVLAAVFAFFVVKAALPSKIAVPDKFSTYTSGTGSFTLDAPVDWARKGEDTKREDGLTGQQYDSDADGATITKGKAIIQVWTDSGTDAMQKQLLSGGGPNFSALLDDRHKEFTGIMKKRVSGFKAEDAGSFSLAPFGAKIVEYTGTSGFLFFGGKVHGYAATVQGPKHFMMICLQCPENNWADLKPVYERILKSAALDGVSAKTLQERLGGFGGGGGGVGGAGGARGIQIPGGGSVSIPPGVGGF